jgi:hypothetical protein
LIHPLCIDEQAVRIRELESRHSSPRTARTSLNHSKDQVNEMITMLLHHVATQLLIHAGGVVPDPAPAPPDGSNALVTLLSWVKWGALVCCAGAAVTAGGMIALGNTSRRAEMAERGKVTLICAVIGAVVIAVAGTLITSSYGLG